LCGSAAAALRELLEGLQVDVAKLGSNLALGGDSLLSESVAVALAGPIGRLRAQQLVEAAVRQATSNGRPLCDVLAEDPAVIETLGLDRLKQALDPTAYLGVSDALIDRALAQHSALGS
jgi:3-carboxy-cis,cis-muconate cycloisomerase